jgi:hypothetical protein
MTKKKVKTEALEALDKELRTRADEQASLTAGVYQIMPDPVAVKEIELCAGNQGILPEDFIKKAVLEKLDRCSSTDWREKWS